MESTFPPALVLCGGLGKRLRAMVADRPKPLAPVGGRPFLEWLLLYLKAQGVEDVVLATGYLSEMIEAHFGNGARLGLRIAYSVESSPLGTGGAMRRARAVVGEGPFFFVNGDTLFAVELREMVRACAREKADLAVALKFVDNNSRYGRVVLEDERVRAFAEKPADPSPSWINGGTFLLGPGIFDALPDRETFSFEADALPALITARRMLGFRQTAYFCDIGLPEAYHAFAVDLPTLIAAGVFGVDPPPIG